jgi:hypothetical protein
MNPTFTDGQSCIEISISIPGMFYGADLIYNYPGWNNEEKNALLNWAASMAESAKQWNATGNFENWRVNFIASAGALLNDESLLTYAFDRYKAIIDFQINGMGQMVQELGRTNSLSYSLYAMNAMIQTAEIARLRGIDLYNYTYDGSRSLHSITMPTMSPTPTSGPISKCLRSTPMNSPSTSWLTPTGRNHRISKS